MMSLADIKYLPRWVILIIDILIVIFSIYITYYIINHLSVEPYQYINTMQKYILIVTINMAFMFIYRTYSGIIRHSTFFDVFKVFLASLSTCFTLLVGNYLTYWFLGRKIFLTPFIGIFFAISFALLFLFRLAVKEVFHLAREIKKSHSKKKLLVLGIDDQSVALANAIIENTTLPYNVRGFLTSRTDSRRAKLLGKEIFSKDKLIDTSKEDLDIDGVLINRDALSTKEVEDWVSIFLEKDLKIFKAPSVQKMREGDMARSIKNLQIEDLLNRKPISLDDSEVKKRHFERVVLITGGAGSIGSEIVRQVAEYEPSLIIVLDQAETPLYDVELEMRENFPNVKFKFVLADISNLDRLEPIFQTYNISMVYHAAAYKHVPIIEDNPHEAITVNLHGSRNLSLLASKYNVNRFVMISTDKAVNPTNVMGASKRAAELFVQSLQNIEGNTTKFITTRFGNVLGSNGSVIPYFKKQIEKGGPVTITHPEIVRYFMTIPEACELVLQAGTMGNGGEIYVFDMGEPVKILDLARRMIKLSGLVPDEDVKIVYTGLRPGEKLYEELLSDETKNMPTHNSKIMISKDPTISFDEIEFYYDEIKKASLQKDQIQVVKILKQIVPEFKSQNSVFQELDK